MDGTLSGMSTTSSEHNGPAPRRLERSRDDRVIAGVCGGLARFANVDATIVRVATVALLAFGGFGAFAYLAAWLLVPEQGQARPLLGRQDQRRSVQVMGIIVLGIVAVCIVGAWGDFGFAFGGWPVLLLVTGGALVWFLNERGETPALGGTAAAPPSAAAATATATAPPASAAEPAREGEDDEPPTLVAEPGEEATRAFGPEPEPASAFAPETDGPEASAFAAQPDGPGTPERPGRERGSWAVTLFSVGGVLLALAAAAGLEAVDAISLGVAGFLALAIVLTGVALVASAFYGGARGLIPVGLLLALVLGGATAAGFQLNGGIGGREYVVRDGDELRGTYELGVGHLELDLRDVELAPGVTHVRADLDVGMLEIISPDARFAGEQTDRDRDGRGEGGIDVERTIIVGSGDRTLEIEAHVGIGALGIRRSDGDDWEWSEAGRPLPVAPPARQAAERPARPRCLGLGFAAVQACEGGRDEA